MSEEPIAKTVSDVLEYLYKNDRKELAEVVLKLTPNIHKPVYRGVKPSAIPGSNSNG